jgi:hypothetical protein
VIVTDSSHVLRGHERPALKAKAKAKAVQLHAMKALGERGGIAPTHSRPRH